MRFEKLFPFLCMVVHATAQHSSNISDRVVTYDERSVLINGTRKLILAGTVHYARVLPDDWNRVFSLAKELGLNTIQTYFMWNFHEHKRGNWSWEGRRDLKRFIQTADEHGLYVNVRIGPYVCGEYYFGGIPIWLRAEDNVQCFRCSDVVWKREMQRVVNTVTEYLYPLLAQNGGNVIMLQVENEYNGGDQAYLEWAVNMAVNATNEVPWNLCHDHDKCAEVNNGGASIKALCTINGFWMDEYKVNPSQPSPKWIADNRAANAYKIPTIWTEDQGWFDQWGVAKRIRTSRDQLYGIARFISYGGSWHSFYMFTGGNNYGRQAGGDVITAYAPDTVLSNYLLRHRGRWRCYQQFFGVMNGNARHLLASPRIPTPQPLRTLSAVGPAVLATLLPCTDTDPAHPGRLDASQRWSFANENLRITTAGATLCVDAGHAGITSLPLVPCSGSQTQRFHYNESNTHFASVIRVPCVSPPNKGKQCHVCLDHSDPEDKVSLWDCKDSSVGQQANQQWQPFNAKDEGGIRPAHQSLCLTATAAQHGMLEVVEFDGAIAFLSNTADENSALGDEGAVANVSYRGSTYSLSPHSVSLVQILPSGAGGPVLMDTSKGACAASKDVAPNATYPLGKDGPRLLSSQYASAGWEYFSEVAADRRSRYNRTSVNGPLEQLNLTDNDSDYLWYVLNDLTGLPPVVAAADIKVTAVASTVTYAYVLAGGHVVDRLESARADGAIAILACAMGLSNGGVGPRSTKGISGVKVHGISVTNRAWTHRWIMRGEDLQVYTLSGKSRVQWSPLSGSQGSRAHTWFGASIASPTLPPHALEASGPGYAVALDLSSMWKGAAYVNGFNIGRYWQENGECKGSCAPPIKNGHCYMHWKDCDRPTQTLYHVPTSVLVPDGNNWVVLFEEAAAPPLGAGPALHRNLSSVKLVLLTDR